MPELSVTSGGTLVNAEGKTSEKGTFNVASPWCDYFGTRNGITEGIAILQHPANRWYPSPWFTRDYGFFSPTPMNWLEGDQLDLPKGQKLTLSYRVIVHTGDVETSRNFGPVRRIQTDEARRESVCLGPHGTHPGLRRWAGLCHGNRQPFHAVGLQL